MSKKIQFEVRYAAGLDRSLRLPAALHRLLLLLNNLFINAIYAMRAAATKRLLLEVSLIEARAEIQIRLSDTGEGVPLPIRHRVFDRHFTTRPNGSGVGLTHVLHVLEEMGGLIFLTDDPSPGYVTTFEVRIPLPPPAPAAL